MVAAGAGAQAHRTYNLDRITPHDGVILCVNAARFLEYVQPSCRRSASLGLVAKPRTDHGAAADRAALARRAGTARAPGAASRARPARDDCPLDGAGRGRPRRPADHYYPRRRRGPCCAATTSSSGVNGSSPRECRSSGPAATPSSTTSSSERFFALAAVPRQR